MDLFKEIYERVENGQRFKVDFKNRKLKVGNKVFIDDGIVADGYEITFPIEPLTEIENCFEDYLYSRPSERSDSNRHTYFKAKSYDELTDEQFICGKPRELTRVKLESTVLFSILGGFKWKEEFGSWYWKSKRFPELIILKEWIV